MSIMQDMGHNLQYDLHRMELYKANPYFVGVVLYKVTR